MRKLFLTILVTLFFCIPFNVRPGNWCKVIYNKDTSEGNLQNQLSKCKNSDNMFLAINSGFANAGHLLNSMVAENCDLNRKVIITKPRSGDPYFTSVCEFRRHNLR
ncbi:MAG: hypothetical protein ACJ0G4_02900 [Alphaproteobacteria bacterium]